jgi:hypothetical protein
VKAYSRFLHFFSAPWYALSVCAVSVDAMKMMKLLLIYLRPENASTTMANGVIDEEELREIVGSK